MFRFKDPIAFILLCGLVFLLPRKKGRILFSSFEDLMPALAMAGGGFLRYLYYVPRCLILVLLIICLARPQLGNVRRDVHKEGIDIMLCLDTSGSMDAMDFKIGDKRVSRLHVVQRVVRDFIRKRGDDRIGLIAFGTEAATITPLSTDYNLLDESVSGLSVGMIGESTSIGVALSLGLKRLETAKGKSKIVILLTDGVNNSGKISPDMARQMAATLKIKVYTIGVGTTGEVPFVVDTIMGKRLVNRAVELDEETLKSIASATGGQYFLAADTQGLEKIYSEIDKLERTKVKTEVNITFKELYHYPLWTALVLLMVEIILLNTRFQKTGG